MSETVLSDELLSMITELNEINTTKQEQNKRIQVLESKLTMAREANLALVNREEKLTKKLAEHGLYLYNKPRPQKMVAQSPLDSSGLAGISNDQITSLLKSLFQNNVNATIQPNIPVNTTIPQIVAAPIQAQPTTSLLDSLPELLPPKQVSPTSAPGLSIRKINNF